MKFIWDTSLEAQTSHYINRLCTVASGFFGKVHGIVLPYFHHNYWYIPDLGLMKDSAFRESIVRLNLRDDYFVSKRSSVFKLVHEMIVDIANTDNEFLLTSDDVEILKHKKIFNRYEKQISKFLELMFGEEELSKIRNIIILPTKFGTTASFGKQKVGNNQIDIIANYRVDVFDRLPSCIFSGCMLLKDKYTNLDGKNYVKWRDRQSIIDFIGKETQFGRLFQKDLDISGKYNDRPTLDMLDGEHGEFAVESARYLASMGYPVRSNFSFDDDVLYYNSNPVSDLSRQQSVLMRTLVERHGKIVNFDHIAQILWKDEWRERFSFDAMSKLVEKTRRVLDKNNISSNTLLTVRKQGYLIWG